ncbi:hypothetical protein CDAR_562391 [Caerostris darwini]|uniref:Uncharacterized protein n=1 Tax=Caerostris darwini TaxID=1538125 RepID=A0AAV4X791_9ARAC|nr:hypothetical protein CDAR_562391 [Caerostris darwini]
MRARCVLRHFRNGPHKNANLEDKRGAGTIFDTGWRVYGWTGWLQISSEARRKRSFVSFSPRFHLVHFSPPQNRTCFTTTYFILKWKFHVCKGTTE